MQTYTFLTKKQFNKIPTWKKTFPDNNVDISILNYHSSWSEMFEVLFNDDRMKLIKNTLSNELKKNSDAKIYPSPDLLFNTFCLTPFKKTKVVFIGQDPYFNAGEAMGLSFSVPHGTKIPSSLRNILENGKKNGHIDINPQHGNLEFWAMQGCLMLNTALTVMDGNKFCHAQTWKWFTDKIIRYISNKKEKVVFVLWGGPAYDKINLIDLDKHEVIISSHPSGLSADKPLRGYPPFNKFDHFGEINKILKNWNMDEIIWQP